jgi:hypothetical protein
MENTGAARHNGLLEEKPAAVGGQAFIKGAEEAVRTIAELELGFRVRGNQPQQDLTGVDAYSREMVSDAVSGVESDRVACGS